MLAHLEAYCTVNEIVGEEADALLAAGQDILDHEEKDFVSFARKGYILHLFRQFIAEQLSLEQFINNGEVLGEDLELQHYPQGQFMQTARREGPYHVLKLFELDDMAGANTIYVLEKSARDSFHHQQQLLGDLEERQSTLVLI